MRVLCVIDGFGPGGAQRQMTNLGAGLRRRGHQIECFVYYPIEEHFLPALRVEGIAVHSIQKRGRLDPRVPWRLSSLVRRGAYDAVLAFLDTPSLYAEIAGAASLMKTPVVVSERGFRADEGSWRRRTLRQGHRLASAVTVNSHYHARRLAASCAWLRGKLRVIYNGVEISPPGAPGPTPRSGSELRLLAIGSVTPLKNPTGLVRGLEACREQYGLRPHVAWAGRVGPGDASQAEYRRAQALLEKAGLGGQWAWLGVRHDVRDLLRECDALVHPSHMEGLPNAVCEAFAEGRPVLASRVGEHPALVADGRTGWLFDPDDAADIGAAICRCARAGAEERRAMGEAARAFARAHLDMDRMVDEYERVLVGVSGGRQRPRAA
jgi:glycosyltransferase involved in cell wall biosynthesis